MFDGLLIASLIGSGVQLIKETLEKPVSGDNWRNKELYYNDLMNGVSVEQRMKNVKNGKYKLTETYPEPHRNANGQIIIENDLLFEEDKRIYGVVQAYKWVKQGKYNLTKEELEKERIRIHKQFKELYG